jgi:thiamine phosphate synthase YjbQ (UPF0047 family)
MNMLVLILPLASFAIASMHAFSHIPPRPNSRRRRVVIVGPPATRDGRAARTATRGGPSPTTPPHVVWMEFVTHYEEVQVDTDRGMSVHDITDRIEEVVSRSGCREGTVTVLSKHSTVSVCINEMESRLVDDVRLFFLGLVPPRGPYLHDDVDYRYGPTDWPGGDAAWRDFRLTQPPNAHSHLIAMMLGTSECIPIGDGTMRKGKYQSVLVVDVDGPKSRSIAVQVTGGK